MIIRNKSKIVQSGSKFVRACYFVFFSIFVGISQAYTSDNDTNDKEKELKTLSFVPNLYSSHRSPTAGTTSQISTPVFDSNQAQIKASAYWKSIKNSGRPISRLVVIELYRNAGHYSVIHALLKSGVISDADSLLIGTQRAKMHNEALDLMAHSGKFGNRIGVNDFGSGEMNAKSDIDFTLYPGIDNVDGSEMIADYKTKFKSLSDGLDPSVFDLVAHRYEATIPDWRQAGSSSEFAATLRKGSKLLKSNSEAYFLEGAYISQIMARSVDPERKTFTWIKETKDGVTRENVNVIESELPFFFHPDTRDRYAFGSAVGNWHFFNHAHDQIDQAKYLLRSLNGSKATLGDGYLSSDFERMTPDLQLHLVDRLYGHMLDGLAPNAQSLKRRTILATLLTAVKIRELKKQGKTSLGIEAYQPLIDLERSTWPKSIPIDDETLLNVAKSHLDRYWPVLLVENNIRTSGKRLSDWLSPSLEIGKKFTTLDKNGRLSTIDIDAESIKRLQFSAFFELKDAISLMRQDQIDQIKRANPRNAHEIEILQGIYATEVSDRALKRSNRQIDDPVTLIERLQHYENIRKSSKSFLERWNITIPKRLDDLSKHKIPQTILKSGSAAINAWNRGKVAEDWLQERAIDQLIIMGGGQKYLPALYKFRGDVKAYNERLASPNLLIAADYGTSLVRILDAYVVDGELSPAVQQVLFMELFSKIPVLGSVLNLYQNPVQAGGSIILSQFIPGYGPLNMIIQFGVEGTKLAGHIVFVPLQRDRVLLAYQGYLDPEEAGYFLPGIKERQESPRPALLLPIAPDKNMPLKERRKKIYQYFYDLVIKQTINKSPEYDYNEELVAEFFADARKNPGNQKDQKAARGASLELAKIEMKVLKIKVKEFVNQWWTATGVFSGYDEILGQRTAGLTSDQFTEKLEEILIKDYYTGRKLSYQEKLDEENRIRESILFESADIAMMAHAIDKKHSSSEQLLAYEKNGESILAHILDDMPTVKPEIKIWAIPVVPEDKLNNSNIMPEATSLTSWATISASEKEHPQPWKIVWEVDGLNKTSAVGDSFNIKINDVKQKKEIKLSAVAYDSNGKIITSGYLRIPLNLRVEPEEKKEEEPTPPRTVTCDSEVRQGGNTPETIIIDTVNFEGNAKFSWEMYTVKDQMRAYVGNNLIHDTGCVSHSGEYEIPIEAKNQTIKVEVLPNCDKPDITKWTFRVDCEKKNTTLKLIKIEGLEPKDTPTSKISYQKGEAGYFEHTIIKSAQYKSSVQEYLGSLQIINPPRELILGEPFRLEIDAQYLYKRLIMDCPLGYQTFGPPEIAFQGMRDLKGKEIQVSCPVESKQIKQIQGMQKLNYILHFNPENSSQNNDSRTYRYLAKSESKNNTKIIESYYDISLDGIVFSAWLNPRSGAPVKSYNGIRLHYAPVTKENPEFITNVPPYSHPSMSVDPFLNDTKSDSPISDNTKSGSSKSNEPDPSKPTSINPNDPKIAGLISAWISSAEPPINATKGANTRYEPWGRMVGDFVTATAWVTAKPDDVGAMSSPEYLWGKRDKLDSVNHCTLSEYVIARLKSESIAHCKNRYKPIIPKLVGMTQREAQRRINRLKLRSKVIIGSPAPSAGLSSTVERQDIKQGNTLKRGETVSIWVHSPFIKPVSIPDLTGKTHSEAVSTLKTLGLKVRVLKGDTSPSPKLSSKVQSQQPLAGLVAKKGSLVSIRVYTSYVIPRVSVPDLSGKTLFDAKSILKSLGLRSRIQQGTAAPSFQLSNKVQSQHPSVGFAAKKGSAVAIKIYTPYISPYINVPDLSGKTIAEAQGILASLRLRSRIERGVAAPSAELSDKVMSQRPLAGLATKKDSLVVIKVYSTYIPPILMPDLINLQVSTAKQKLESLGLFNLTISKGDMGSSKAFNNKVQRQMPSAGTVIKKGKRLELVVYIDFKDKILTSPISGLITDKLNGQPIAGVTISVDSDPAPIQVVSSNNGSYRMLLPTKKLSDFFVVTASANGYLSSAVNVSKQSIKNGKTIDFTLLQGSINVISVEPVPTVHHLGDDSFSGTINSGFQKKSEGKIFTTDFTLTQGQLDGYDTAEITMLARGAQFGNSITINGTLIKKRINGSPNDGSFGSFTAKFKADLLQTGTNTLTIKSARAGDYDDFEFVNIQIKLSQSNDPVVPQPDRTGGGSVSSPKTIQQTISAKFNRPPSANVWKHYRIRLTADSFGVDAQTFKQILANVSSFRIRTEMHDGDDIGGVDEVRIGNMFASSYNAGLNGWNAAGDGTMKWVSSGGVSGGYLQIRDWASGDWHWAVAPPNWSGNWQSLIGSSIDFYYKTDHPSDSSEIQISSKHQNRLGLAANPLTIPQKGSSWLTIQSYPVSSQNLLISLSSSNTRCITVSATVSIPARRTEIKSKVIAIGKSGCDSVITATTTGYGQSRITLSIEGGNVLKIPDVINTTLALAKQKMHSMGFRVVKISKGSRAPSQKYNGKVISQSPRAGTPAKRGDHIELVLYSNFQAVAPRPGHLGSGSSTTSNGRTFINPKWKGHIVDNCVTWATTCNGGGAQNFCRLKGFAKASKWKHQRPGKTYVIGSKKVCDGSFCIGYSSITCVGSNTTTFVDSVDSFRGGSAPTRSGSNILKVPNVVNATLAVAKQKMRSMGFKVVKISKGGRAPSQKYNGKIISQKPTAGTPAKRGDRVELVLYSNFKKNTSRRININGNGNILVNGSFETGLVDPDDGSHAVGNFARLATGSPSLTGWKIVKGNIDYVGTSIWQASDGVRSIDLDGATNIAGAIEQSFSTKPGATYQVEFDIAGNYVKSPVVKPMMVSADGQTAQFSFNTLGKSASNMGWTRKIWTFVADDNRATLKFQSLSAPSGYGAVIDNIRVRIKSEKSVSASNCNRYSNCLLEIVRKNKQIAMQLMSDDNRNSGCHYLAWSKALINMAQKAKSAGCPIDGNIDQASKIMNKAAQGLCHGQVSKVDISTLPSCEK